ncbi:MAG: hypothetical protein PHI44_00515 [Candidatus Ratteibacteria bacterium]|nr:hypothetical protein [Candidatus Ratteibacteria bacterium]
MNKFLEKTIKIAIDNSYLDTLLDIYPPEEIERGLVVENFTSELKDIFTQKEDEKLLEELIKLKKKGFKFPIENSYVNIISYSPKLIYTNPKTVKNICKELYKLSYEKLKENLETSKKASRRMGHMFQSWLKKKYRFVNEETIENIKDEIVFLDGSDKTLKDFAQRKLKCQFKDLTKGIDFLVKVFSKYYIIGTAKFLTDFGGSQTNQFYEAMNFIRETKAPKNVKRIAIVDGIVWFAKKGKIKERIESIKDDELVFSALLLDEFLKGGTIK